MAKMITMVLSSYTIFSKNQMTMIVVIISTCTTLSALVFLSSNIHWFSLLILIIYISGVMVLFMFIVSLTPNEKMSFKNNHKMMSMMFLIFMIMKKPTMNSENLKINTVIESNLMAILMIFTIIMMMAYLPPKMMTSLYKGMKSTK